jgi:polysaccharide export outer membrane protein
MIARTLISFLISLTCAAAQLPAGAAGVKVDRDTYIIGPGDVITVAVLDSQDIPDKPMQVDPEGQIALPLVGRVEVAGKSVSALEKEITVRLRDYIRNPQVSVNVTTLGSRPVSVLGAVNAPGVYQLGGTKNLAQVIALAKGLAPDAGGLIRITRYRSDASAAEGTDTAEVRPSITLVNVKDLLSNSSEVASIPIRTNDVITVPKAAVVYVIGEVKNPGAQKLNDRETITVLEALSAAAGVLPTGSPQHAKLLRRDPKTSQRVETALNVKRIMTGKADNITLRQDDILLIPRNTARAIGLKTVDAAIQLGTGALIYR